MTAKTAIEISDKMHSLVSDIRTILSNIVRDFIRLGHILTVIQEQKLYTRYAAGIETYDEFLKDIGVGRSTAYNCTRIYSTFGGLLLAMENADHRATSIDYSRLVKILPLIGKDTTEEEKIEWLRKAEALPIDGFMNAIAAHRGSVPTDECHHENTEFYERCTCCGKFLKVSREGGDGGGSAGGSDV